MSRGILLFFLSILSSYYLLIDGGIEFTNVICTSLDKSLTEVEYCFLKSVNRTYKYMSLRINVKKIPINNLEANWSVMKKANGYKPFLYNMTFDACVFLKSSQNMVIRFIHGLFKDFSNLNHSCPFNHDIIVDKLGTKDLEDRLRQKILMPYGEYAFISTWFTRKKPGLQVNLYFKLF